MNPTYHDLGDHTESFEIWYNPDELSYAQLLAYVWDSHDPSYSTRSVQYRNVIWVHDAEQEECLVRIGVKDFAGVDHAIL